MAYDYSKLMGRIVEKFTTQSRFAKAMGMSEHSMSNKLNNNVPFKQGEISKACSVLDIAVYDIPDYFFTLKVQ